MQKLNQMQKQAHIENAWIYIEKMEKKELNNRVKEK